jgi:RNA polymerase sigma-70 factor (ECF subfamily)
MRTVKDRQPDPDRELVTHARHHADPEERRRAAADLLDRHRTQVYAWCLRRVADPDRARDLTQDVLLSAYSGLSGFRGRSPYVSWLWCIARNRCVSELRRPSPLDEGVFDLDTLPATSRRPDEELEERIGAERLDLLIRTALTREERDALRMRCIERLSVAEITRQLHLTRASGARGLLQRARRKLRAALVRNN